MSLLKKILSSILIIGLNVTGVCAQSEKPVPDRHSRSAPLSDREPTGLTSAILDITGPYKKHAELIPPGSGTFGGSIAVSGHRAVVGDRSNQAEVLEMDPATGRWRSIAILHGNGGLFGHSVAILDDTIAVGAPEANEVHVFKRDTNAEWLLHEVLSGSDLGVGSSFGASVGLSSTPTGVVLAAGAPDFQVVFLFDDVGTSWSLDVAVNPPDVATLPFDSMGFGAELAIEGERLVVGWPSADLPGFESTGSVYTFVRSAGTWAFQQKLTPESFSGDYAWFGYSIAISGDMIAIGQPWYDNLQGAVHTYVFDPAPETWIRRSTLQESNGGTNDQFYGSVALAGERLLVGAIGHDIGASNSNEGALFAYSSNGAGGWTLDESWVGLAPGDQLFAGASTGDTILAGALTADQPFYPDRGHVRVFRKKSNVWIETQPPIYATGDDGEFFGEAVAVSGDTAVVASVGLTDPNTGKKGVAHVYARDSASNSWALQAVLPYDFPSGTIASSQAIAIDGDTIVLGVPIRADAAAGTVLPGEAHVYHRSGTTWTLQGTLSDPASLPDDAFAWSVAISGDVIALGAIGLAGREGGVYVFDRTGTTWSLRQQLTASNGSANDCFGCAVDVENDRIVVGAPNKNSVTGAVYVFERMGSTWMEKAIVRASGATAELAFGAAVAIDGDNLAVGAPFAEAAGQQFAGRAYLFERTGTTWREQTALQAPAPVFWGMFGHSVALESDRLLSGEPSYGSGYVFKHSGSIWALDGTIAYADDSYLGYSVAISGSTMMLGAPSAGPRGGGRAFILANDDDSIFDDGFEVTD